MTDTQTTAPAVAPDRGIVGFALQTERGLTTIADDVVAKLAGHATRNTEGISAMGKTFRRLLGRIKPGQEALAQGVNVEVGRKEAAIDVVVVVRHGHAIPVVAQQVRENVITAVESQTGLIVKEVNIEVDDIAFDEDASAARVE